MMEMEVEDMKALQDLTWERAELLYRKDAPNSPHGFYDLTLVERYRYAKIAREQVDEELFGGK